MISVLNDTRVRGLDVRFVAINSNDHRDHRDHDDDDDVERHKRDRVQKFQISLMPTAY